MCGQTMTLLLTRRAASSHGTVQIEVEQTVEWDQWRFAALAHHQFAMFFLGGPALEASRSHSTLKLGRAVCLLPVSLPMTSAQ